MKLSLISSLLCAGSLSCLACSGNAESVVPTQEVTDAQADAQAPTHSCGDAGPLVQKQSTNPLLLTHAKIHLIFWGNWWTTTFSAQLDLIPQTWTVVGNDPNFYLPMAEYGVGPGTLEGIYNTNWNLPANAITADYVLKELLAEIKSGDLPANDPSSFYLVLLPSTTHIDTDPANNWDGWHTYNDGMAYGIVEYHQSFVDTDTTISHEIHEAITDTIPNSGYNSGGNGAQEIGDICQGNNFSLDGFTLQQSWSQVQCRCVP
jgi:hypothetical protein